MTDRVAVYIDFDNVVISRYDNLHGDGAWRQDEARDHRPDLTSADPVDVKLAQAEVDLGAIIDYAASFGTVALTRAYADWSVPANAAYKTPLVDRSVDLVQLFAASGPRTAPTSGSRSTPSRTSSSTPTSRTSCSSPATPTTSRSRSAASGSAGTSSASASPARPAGRWSRRATSSSTTPTCPASTPPPQRPPSPRKKAAAGQEVRGEEVHRQEGGRESGPSCRPSPRAEAEATALLVRAVRVGLQKSDDEWVYAARREEPDAADELRRSRRSRWASPPSAPSWSRGADIVESKVDGNGQMLVRLPDAGA